MDDGKNARLTRTKNAETLSIRRPTKRGALHRTIFELCLLRCGWILVVRLFLADLRVFGCGYFKIGVQSLIEFG